MIVVTDPDALRGLPGQADIFGAGVTGSDGEPIGVDTLRRYTCDCTISQVVLGPNSEILDLGRASRTATAARRRALFIRYGGCVFRAATGHRGGARPTTSSTGPTAARPIWGTLTHRQYDPHQASRVAVYRRTRYESLRSSAPVARSGHSTVT